MNENEIRLGCRKLIGGCAEGEAIVSREAICFYLCDPETGELLDKNHHLKGKSLANKVLLLTAGKGSSVVQLDGLFQMKEKGKLPLAMIVMDADPVLVSSVYVVEVPLVDRVEKDPYAIIEDGDWVRVDADNECVVVKKKSTF
jgi:hypothetical protein